MALLATVELNTVPGLTYVNYSPAFLGLSILTVKREGRQYKRVAAADIESGEGREWCLRPGITLRIKFPDSTPFNEGEKVFVIYKPIV